MGNWKIIGFFLSGTLLFSILLRVQGESLVTSASPLGILSLELAFSAGKAESIVVTWKDGHSLSFVLNMLLDFFFIPFYGLFFYSVCGFFSEQYKTGILQRVAVLLAFGSLIAVLMDLLENLLMLISFYWQVGATGVIVTGIAAVIKFTLVAFCLVYILFSSAYILLKKALR
ncbi:MAG: hypothetical protein KIT80_16465 [Chitinophagaceae bacterium]|nr:hypothetical protein [Chitinophagaceae bacterium]MCW5928512.1 hypothetical protein [Chitinophagaceae bacterium]